MIGLLFPPRSVVCSVHERQDHAANVLLRADELIFLREGFSWPVAILPPVALLTRGSWVALAAYVVLASLALYALSLAGAEPAWSLLALVVLGVIFGFEASALERWTLARRGWDEVGVVSGADEAECERRFFDGWLPLQPTSTAQSDNDPTQPSLLRRLFAARP